MRRKPSIAIVGPGRLGRALAKSLADAGFPVEEIVARSGRDALRRARSLAQAVGARVLADPGSALNAGLVWLCVPDAEIRRAADALSRSRWRGRVVFHSSGVLSSDELGDLRRAGASVASVHPLMTFVARSAPDLRGTPFAIEGDARAVAVARRIVRQLGGQALALRKQDKIAYHAFATMICPLLVSLLASSQRVAALAGVPRGKTRRLMMPILRQTLRNFERLGADESFSGPIVRGDAETVDRHLAALQKAPAARRVYVALVKAALEELPARSRKEILRLLR